MDILFKLLIQIILIALNAFFAASELALVSLSISVPFARGRYGVPLPLSFAA